MGWNRGWKLGLAAVLVAGAIAGAGCNGPDAVNNPPPVDNSEYIVLAWNDLGMHCLNPTYDQAVILPPYNVLWAQVIRRGNPPAVVTENLAVSYRVVDNTSSYGKTDSFGGAFAQFWDNAQKLFGVNLAHDTGLNLETPSVHNGLSGTMAAKGDHFQVNGIPLTPVLDNGTWTPYQVAEVTVKNAAGTVVAQTRATVPTSDEIHCDHCHAQGGTGTVHIGGGTADAFKNVLQAHDVLHGTQLAAAAPVLCSSCHPSPALGGTSANPEMYLSAAIHGSHASRGAACYDCHPGSQTQCNRSLAHEGPDGNCTTCHGSMAQVASSITGGSRVPWLSEPKCATCHTGVTGVDTGSTLYRNATGHGGVYCEGCHGSPHAMVPSGQESDNYQVRQYQNKAVTLGSCAACHSRSHGGGASEFGEEHGGSNGRATACNVCHTQVSTNTANWPHAFTWKNR